MFVYGFPIASLLSTGALQGCHIIRLPRCGVGLFSWSCSQQWFQRFRFSITFGTHGGDDSFFCEPGLEIFVQLIKLQALMETLITWVPLTTRLSDLYSLHQKKVYTCGKAKYSKSREARGKVGGAPHPPLSWSKLDQASFWNSKRWRHKNFEFQNEAWPSLDQLNGGFGAPPTFHLAPLSFEYSARQKCILSFGGDCS